MKTGDQYDVTGLIPAGGIASRLGKIPLSKELFPIVTTGMENKIGVISDNLLRSYKNAGITRVFFIIRKGKWDIPEYYGDGGECGMHIGYLMMDLPFGSPFTLNQAYPFIHDKIVALGFPDIIIEPEDCFTQLVKNIRQDDSDVVLGVFPITTFSKWDMVEFDDNDRIKKIVIKQNRPDLHYGWSVAVWKPSFTAYMNDYLVRLLKHRPDGKIESSGGRFREVYIGDIFQDAINHGMKFGQVRFEKGSCIDLGTPDDLRKYIRLTSG